jgi:hypothetical protein
MCFSLAWLGNLLIWIVVLVAVVALIRLLISFVVPKIGIGADAVSFIVQALTIVMWAVVCIAAIWFIFELIECLVSAGGLGFPKLR